jgi:hypothetical protein
LTRPVRLRLSRAKGFNLQAHSLAVNGLPAVNCARPSKWGNPVIPADFHAINRALETSGRAALAGTWRQHAVKCFDAWLGGEIPELGTPPTVEEIKRELRGKNLACWCPLDGQPCHCDVLLEIAN